MSDKYLYEVGDCVMIREDLKVRNFYRMLSGPCEGQSLPINYIMKDFGGKICTIKRHSGGGNYCLEEDPDGFFWTDEMFKPAPNECQCESLL